MDDRYEGFSGGANLLLDIYNPLNKPRIITEGPDQVDLFGLAYTSAVVYGGVKLASLITGEKILFSEYLMHRGDMARRFMLSAGRGAIAVAPTATFFAVGGVAFYGALKGVEYGVDKAFGEPLRESVRSDKRGGKESSLFYLG
jgi:hypothetical protein